MIEKLSSKLKKLIKIVYRFVTWGNEVNCHSEPLGEESHTMLARDFLLSFNMTSFRIPIRNM